MPHPMNIGEAAQAAGISAKMIRHYEQIGLVASAARTEAGYRQYSERDVAILRFIRQSRRLGFSMAQIADLLGLWHNDRRSSREVKALAQSHLAELEEKMHEMAAMQQALQKLVHACHGDDDPQCAILDELAVDGTEAPQAAQAAHHPAPRAGGKRGAVAEATSAAHTDLMAWTRNIHAGHGQH